MIVYRVEDGYGNGYTETLECHIKNFTSYGVTMMDEDYMERRPLPEDDGIYTVNDYHLFGFKYLEQIRGWFGDAQIVLGNILGAVVIKLWVPSDYVTMGGKQVIFDSREAEVLATYPMDYFLPKDIRECLFDFKEQVQESLELGMDIPEQLKFLITLED